MEEQGIVRRRRGGELPYSQLRSASPFARADVIAEVARYGVLFREGSARQRSALAALRNSRLAQP